MYSLNVCYVRANQKKKRLDFSLEKYYKFVILYKFSCLLKFSIYQHTYMNAIQNTKLDYRMYMSLSIYRLYYIEWVHLSIDKFIVHTKSKLTPLSFGFYFSFFSVFVIQHEPQKIILNCDEITSSVHLVCFSSLFLSFSHFNLKFSCSFVMSLQFSFCVASCDIFQHMKEEANTITKTKSNSILFYSSFVPSFARDDIQNN